LNTLLDFSFASAGFSDNDDRGLSGLQMNRILQEGVLVVFFGAGTRRQDAVIS
jgi:hypothetical protein